MDIGTVVECECPKTLGHPDTPLSDDELLHKMRTLLSPLYGAAFADALWQSCVQLQYDANGEGFKKLMKLVATMPRE